MILCMDRGETFSIGFRTFDHKKDTGGEWIYFDKACKHNYLTAEERLSELHKKDPLRRNPQHYKNSTRNIRVIANGNIVKVHIRLIRKFNGKTVM